MRRDPSATKEALLDAAQRLFAAEGVHGVATNRIVLEAGQRNVSAITYHFGSRENLLFAILDRHNVDIERERRELLDEIEPLGSADVRSLVRAVVVPFSRKLSTTEGRQFLTIVAQLSDLFDRWHRPGPRTPEQARRALEAIASVLATTPGLPTAALSLDLRRERVSRFLGLVVQALGARARQMESGSRPSLSTASFLDNLVDMSVGALVSESTLR